MNSSCWLEQDYCQEKVETLFHFSSQDFLNLSREFHSLAVRDLIFEKN